MPLKMAQKSSFWLTFSVWKPPKKALKLNASKIKH